MPSAKEINVLPACPLQFDLLRRTLSETANRFYSRLLYLMFPRLAIIQAQCAESREQLETSTINTLVSESTAQKFEIMIAEKEEKLRQLQKELDKTHGIKVCARGGEIWPCPPEQVVTVLERDLISFVLLSDDRKLRETENNSSKDLDSFSLSQDCNSFWIYLVWSLLF